MREKILFHSSCGPCATSSIQSLIDDGYDVVLCYGNSNIWPEEENDRRFANLLKVAEYFGNIEVHRQKYDHEAWLTYVKGLENEPEHGERCLKCYEYNLSAAYEEAKRLGIDKFTTTLTVSRFKKSDRIFSVGKMFDGFTPIDFKKRDGFARSCQMAKDLNLYRQQYCGCEFSIKREETNA